MLCRRLAEERRRLGLTQAELAEKCGIKVTAQYFYEKGRRAPNSDYLKRAADAGVSLPYIFGLHVLSEALRGLSHEQVYKLVDDICRDTHGRLLDTEIRAKVYSVLMSQGLEKAKEVEFQSRSTA